MKKKLNTAAIENELKGSVFFPQQKDSSPSPSLQPVESPKEQEAIVSSQEQHSLPEYPAFTPVNESMQASEKASKRDSMLASTLSLGIDLEDIRKTLKLVGKEVLYVRLTPQEKKQISDIEYTYQQQGIKTSSNEIGRVGINFLLADYQVNGEQSILAKLLSALHT